MKSSWILLVSFAFGMLLATHLGCARNTGLNRSLASNNNTPVLLQTGLTNSSPNIVTLQPGEDLSKLMLDSTGPVLVDFFADWCGPCRRQSTILHDFASTSDVGAMIVKVNVDEHPELARKYDVNNLPTLVSIQDGNVKDSQIGLANAERIAQLIGQ